MDEAMKDRLTSRDLWMRVLFMILFVIAYGVAEILVALTVVVQFLIILFTGSANELLLRFGNNLSAYIYQIIQFETFNSEDRPFPFSDWPDDPLPDNRWLRPATPPAASPATAEPEEAPARAATEETPATPQPAAPADDAEPEQSPPSSSTGDISGDEPGPTAAGSDEERPKD